MNITISTSFADESVTSMIKVPDIESEQYLVMVTRNGIIKRTELSAFSHARKNGLIAIDLNEGDELAWVRLTDGNKELIVATETVWLYASTKQMSELWAEPQRVLRQ